MHPIDLNLKKYKITIMNIIKNPRIKVNNIGIQRLISKPELIFYNFALEMTVEELNLLRLLIQFVILVIL